MKQSENLNIHRQEVATPHNEVDDLIGEIRKVTSENGDSDVREHAYEALGKIDCLMQAYYVSPTSPEKIRVINELGKLICEIRRAVEKVESIRSLGDSKKDRQLHEAVMEFLDQTLVETDEELKLNFFTE